MNPENEFVAIQESSRTYRVETSDHIWYVSVHRTGNVLSDPGGAPEDVFAAALRFHTAAMHPVYLVTNDGFITIPAPIEETSAASPDPENDPG